MRKLVLTPIEKKNLITKKVIIIERELNSEPISSIIFGIGTKQLWDKIDSIWVFGDVESYIESMKNVGRKAWDYPDNTSNWWNGANWWECVRDINPYGKPNQPIVNGRKNPLTFKIDAIHISKFNKTSLKYDNDIYLKPVLLIQISL